MTEFNTIWSYIQTNLKIGTTIKNWTAYSGYLGDTMKVTAVRKNCIEVDAPNAKSTQIVPKDDFEKVWEVWSDYKDEVIKRYEVRDMTRFSKYIISILHWYENA